MSWALDQDWTLLKRARDMSRAYEIGLREAPAAIYAETSYHVEEFLAGLLPALLQLCIVQALATAIGAGIGAGLGALVFGAGAIPGAAVGAEAGFDLGLIILGWLGLAFLAAAIAHSLGDVVTLLKHAVVQAWRAADAHEDERRQQVRQAGQTLARAMAVLVRLILQGIVAWLLKRGIDKAPELIAELKASRLGVAFGEWVEKNLGRLVNDPKLRPHAGEGSTTKVATKSTAQTPSEVAKKPPAEEPPAEEPPPPPPPPKSVKTFPKSPDEMTKTLGVEPSKVSRTPDGTQRVVWEPNANTRIRFESHPEGLSPDAPGFNPRHHGEHYHIEMKPDGMSWNQANKQGLITKAKPDGYLPGQGTGFVPGEPFPGQ